MPTIVYRISVLLGAILADVPVGTNLGLFWLLWTLISGRFLLSRGAVFPALADGGLAADAVRRSGAALAYGRWAIQTLVHAWQQVVQQDGTPIVMKASVRWRVTSSASSALGSAAVWASTTRLGPTKPCRPSSWRWLRQSVPSAKSVCLWSACFYEPTAPTSVKPTCNAGRCYKQD